MLIKKVIKNAAIYCRISSEKARHLNSLTTKISALTRMVYYIPSCRLKGIYVDIASAKTPQGVKNTSECCETAVVGKLTLLTTWRIPALIEKK